MALYIILATRTHVPGGTEYVEPRAIVGEMVRKNWRDADELSGGPPKRRSLS